MADKFGLNKYIRLNHTVIGAFWDEDEQMWTVRVERGDGTVFEDKAHVFVNASGVLK